MDPASVESSWGLLLSSFDKRDPVLQSGLVEQSAVIAPRPPDEDFTLEALDENNNDLRWQRWVVIAPEGVDGDRALEAIGPLIQLRTREQEAHVEIHRVRANMTSGEAYVWKLRYLRPENKNSIEWPHYVLVLGDLHQVSEDFQHVISDGLSVGRIHFAKPDGSPDLDAYAAYAQKVVRYAESRPDFDEADAFFFVASDGTSATKQGREFLIDPCMRMAESAKIAAPSGMRSFPVRHIESWCSINNAVEFIRRGSLDRPATLLSVSHGSGRPKTRDWSSVEEQRTIQGALELDGQNAEGLVTANVLRDKPFLPGGFWFLVACWGGGTPAQSVYYSWLEALKRLGAYRDDATAVLRCLPRAEERPFLAALPQAALANPNGPLGVIAHLDLAWTAGFLDLQTGRSRASRIFNSLQPILRGARIGLAHRELRRGFSEANGMLTEMYDREELAYALKKQVTTNPLMRCRLFMLRNDLRGYFLLGDPAARLPIRPGT